jgi:hypothetical protein
MAFTYDLTTETGKLRLEIGDEIQGKGTKPNGANFEDAELAYFLGKFTGTEAQVQLAAAYACEVLARQWSRHAGTLAIGSGEYSEAFRQADAYAARAAELRAEHGGGGQTLKAGTIRIPFQADNT